MYCRCITAVKRDETGIHATALRCKSWNCPDCAPWRRRRLIAQGIGGQPNTFLTLTVSRADWPDPELAAVALAHAWRVVRLRAIREARRNTHRRKYPTGARPPGGWKLNSHGFVQKKVILDGEKLPFLAVFERTKAGWPHLHILIRSRWIDHSWLRAQMLDTMKSPIVHIERLHDSRKGAVYCSKYCSKATDKFLFCKRYWCSQNYDLREEYSLAKRRANWSQYSIFKMPIKRLLAHLEYIHWLVHVTGEYTADLYCPTVRWPWGLSPVAAGPPQRTLSLP